MKIGFVLDDGLDKADGVQQYILTLGAWYQEQGHQVRYLVGQTSRTDIRHIYAIPKNIKVRFNGNYLSIPLPAPTKKIKAVLEAEKFDLLHIQMPYSPFFGAKVVNLAAPETTIVGTFHILPYGTLSKAGTYLLGLLLRKSLKKINAFISVSEPAAKFARRVFGIRSCVLPNTVMLSEFNGTKFRQPQKNSLRILFLGRLVERKGCQELLHSIKILHNKKVLPAKLEVNICGDGPLRNELESFVRKNDLSSIVSFRGYVTQSQKVSFMQTADLAVFPSLGGESFGIVLIEAMAAGSGVVLGGDNPGYRSVLASIPESIISADKPEVMAKQLLEFINNSEKRSQLHKIQQAYVKQFDTPVVGRRLLKIYQTCKDNHIS